jgi:hypothetical protein
MDKRLDAASLAGKAVSLLRRAEVDRAVLYVLAGRVWLIPQTLVTLLLVSRCLTAELQGYYYTFFSILGLQAFFELGLSQVTVNMASHEWSSLRLNETGEISGEIAAHSRLAGLARFTVIWYSLMTCLFVAVVGTAGYVFLAAGGDPEIAWSQPWCATVLLAGLTLWTGAPVGLLEGCNQVSQVGLYRLCQSVFGRLALWAVLALGGELWAVVGSLTVGLLCSFYFLGHSYGRFFSSILRPPSGEKIRWRSEIWPMQWRVGISSAVGFFGFTIFVPIVFHYQGAAMAGRMGMTLQAVGSLHQAAMAWVTTKAPTYGILIRKALYEELDALWFRCSAISVGLMACGSVLICLLVHALSALELSVAHRLLPVLPTALFLAGATIFQVTQCQAAYLRAHKQEPMAAMNVVISLTIGLFSWMLGSRFGPEAVSRVYLAASVATLIWGSSIWARRRKEWHGDAATSG